MNGHTESESDFLWQWTARTCQTPLVRVREALLRLRVPDGETDGLVRECLGEVNRAIGACEQIEQLSTLLSHGNTKKARPAAQIQSALPSPGRESPLRVPNRARPATAIRRRHKEAEA